MPVYSTKKTNSKSHSVTITDKKDSDLFFLLKALDCVSRNINAFTTFDKESRNILAPILLKQGVLLVEMQLFSENLYFVSSLLENGCVEIFSNSRFKIYKGSNKKIMIKDVHKGNLFVHQVAIPGIIKTLSEQYKISIEKSSYKNQINNILKKYI